jgi:hypothetical protein
MRFGQKNPLRHTWTEGRWYDQPGSKKLFSSYSFQTFLFLVCSA